MKNTVILALTLLIALAGRAQGDFSVKRMIVSEGLYMKGRWIDELRNDTVNIELNKARTILTTKGVLDLVSARSSKWFYTSGTPSSTLGTTGDFYINSANKNLYNKTDASTWEFLFVLSGGEGGDGDAGDIVTWD
ncbi:MAG: hypothetical protein ACTHMM_17700 [Agriterribacter sp.]